MAHLTVAPASTLDVTGVPIKNDPDVIQDIFFFLFVIIQVHSVLCTRMKHKDHGQARLDWIRIPEVCFGAKLLNEEKKKPFVSLKRAHSPIWPWGHVTLIGLQMMTRVRTMLTSSVSSSSKQHSETDVSHYTFREARAPGVSESEVCDADTNL